ncbi:MAG TPA: colanic acid biosynthesis glycosyltransferase WcaL, partial [Chloroflexota bacterium]|nr:colanic acid biosynthesis glycosyltransferase WcaL [Chloroflexota bacterium]
GLLVRQQDPQGLAIGLESLLTNEDLRVRLATRARYLIETEFDIDQNTKVMRDIMRASQPISLGALSGTGR